MRGTMWQPDAMYTESALWDSWEVERGDGEGTVWIVRELRMFSKNNISSTWKTVVGKMFTRFCAKGLNFGRSLVFGKILMIFRATDSNFGLSRGTRPSGILVAFEYNLTKLCRAAVHRACSPSSSSSRLRLFQEYRQYSFLPTRV